VYEHVKDGLCHGLFISPLVVCFAVVA
jgi:hypothetical protein